MAAPLKINTTEEWPRLMPWKPPIAKIAGTCSAERARCGEATNAITLESAMPYVTNDDLPPSVRSHLPGHGQDIYREAFNRAWQEYADDPRLEEIAHRVAWAAVKKVYVKAGSEWVRR
jgi:cation transport regulator